jgi:hypothetical protein
MSADEAPVPGAETMDALALAADAPARVAAWRKRWDAFEARHASAFAPGAAAEVERRAEEAFARFPKPKPKPKRRAPKGDEKAAPAAKAEKEKAERVPSAKVPSVKAIPPTPPTLPTPPPPRESNRTASAKAPASRDPTFATFSATTRKQPGRPTARGGSGPDADARRASFAAREKEKDKTAVGKEARRPIGAFLSPAGKPKPAAARPSEGGSGRSKKAVDAAALYPSSPYAAAAPRRRRAF